MYDWNIGYFRHSDMIKVKPLRTSWAKKMEERGKKKSVKAFEKELKEAKTKELEVGSSHLSFPYSVI